MRRPELRPAPLYKRVARVFRYFLVRSTALYWIYPIRTDHPTFADPLTREQKKVSSNQSCLSLIINKMKSSSSSSSNLSENASNLFRCAGATGRVSKHSYRDAVSEEMQVYFSKLKELVPFMPKNKKLSKLEIIQYVIDYICDLQLALESHPARSPPGSNSNSPGPSSPNRTPLGVITTPNTRPNTCAAQEATHLDKVPSHLDDLGTRPVSC